MEMFPNLEIGLSNGWILIVLFFGAYGIMFPKMQLRGYMTDQVRENIRYSADYL
jgi:hypothetical protein